MKIEKITICNLTSIEGKQVIDFTQEPLRSAGLFAITGRHGGGQSLPFSMPFVWRSTTTRRVLKMRSASRATT